MQSNYDQDELNKFRKLAAQWWDTQGPLKTLHDINPLRTSFITKNTTLKDKTVIDIGCGGGILTESLAKQGANLTGIDANDELISVANLHKLESALEIDYQTIYSNELASSQPNKFDAVICMELLEHVPDPQALVNDCAALCKPGGKLFFSTINRSPIAYALGIIAAEHILKMVKKGTHDYSKFIKPSELARCCRNAGLSVSKTEGFSYNPITKKYFITKNTSVNYLLIAEKP